MIRSHYLSQVTQHTWFLSLYHRLRVIGEAVLRWATGDTAQRVLTLILAVAVLATVLSVDWQTSVRSWLPMLNAVTPSRSAAPTVAAGMSTGETRWILVAPEDADRPGGITLAAGVGDGRGLYALAPGGLYFSSNGGGAWQRRATAATLPAHPLSLAVAPGNPQVVYLGTSYDGLFKSLDGGATFQPASTGLTASPQVAVTAIYAPTGQPGLLLIATGYWVGTSQRRLVAQGLYLSANEGTTWLQVGDLPASSPTINSLTLDLATLVVTARSAANPTGMTVALDRALLALLRQGNPVTQAQAAVALGLLKVKAAETELTARFWAGDNPLVMAVALAHLGTSTATQTLVRALTDDPLTSRRQAAMTALESLGDEALPMLVSALNDTDPVLRRNVVSLLGWSRATLARPALEQALQDAHPAVQAEAAWALAQMSKDTVLASTTEGLFARPLAWLGSLDVRFWLLLPLLLWRAGIAWRSRPRLYLEPRR